MSWPLGALPRLSSEVKAKALQFSSFQQMLCASPCTRSGRPRGDSDTVPGGMGQTCRRVTNPVCCVQTFVPCPLAQGSDDGGGVHTLQLSSGALHEPASPSRPHLYPQLATLGCPWPWAGVYCDPSCSALSHMNSESIWFRCQG